MKAASGRGSKTTKQGMGRVWEENFCLSIFYVKSGGEEKFLKILLYKPKKNTKISAFLKPQGGGSSEISSFRPIGGVKNCLREGDCVLGGQPMGIPPPSPPPSPTYDCAAYNCSYRESTMLHEVVKNVGMNHAPMKIPKAIVTPRHNYFRLS